MYEGYFHVDSWDSRVEWQDEMDYPLFLLDYVGNGREASNSFIELRMFIIVITGVNVDGVMILSEPDLGDTFENMGGYDCFEIPGI